MPQIILETIFVCILLIIFTLLWAIKRKKQKKATGVDPDVFTESTSNLQQYIKIALNVARVYIIIIIILHASHIHFFSLFERFGLIDQISWKISGFILGLIGLAICLYAQNKMGNSWRVGIDENSRTELITTGLYRFIRNPTYLGLILLNSGIWLIWPTVTIFIFNLIFSYTMDIQVRCEEDFLEKQYGKEYLNYKNTTKRYLPFIY